MKKHWNEWCFIYKLIVFFYMVGFLIYYPILCLITSQGAFSGSLMLAPIGGFIVFYVTWKHYPSTTFKITELKLWRTDNET